MQKQEYGWADKDLKDDLYGNLPFDDVIEDMLKFNAEDWTKFDNTVAAMIVLLGINPARGEKRKRRNESDDEIIKLSLSSLVGTYQI